MSRLAVWLLLAAFCRAASGEDPEVLRPRVPVAERTKLGAVRNPVPATAANLAVGRSLYLGRGFCATCHGRDGRGLGPDVDTAKLRGALPRDFTNRAWQESRSDGELLWILEHGSRGTAMAPFVPRILSEEEAWLVLLHVRRLAP